MYHNCLLLPFLYEIYYYALEQQGLFKYTSITKKNIEAPSGNGCHGSGSKERGKKPMFSSRTIASRIGLVIAAIAAVWTLVQVILGIIGFNGDNLLWGYALLILFVLALILAFVQFAHERPALQSIS